MVEVRPGARRRRIAPTRAPAAGERVVGVLPAVAGIDRVFDYLAEPAQAGAVRVGSLVRVDLAGRRVGGWVVADDPPADPGRLLRPLAHVRGWGPEPELVELAGWAAWRWAGRRGAFLTTASPDAAVARLPPPDLRRPAAPTGPTELLEQVGAALRSSPGILQLPPVSDPTVVVAAAAQRGPTLVVVPSAARAAVLAGRLRRAGAAVALVPEQWAAARAGAAVVVGARAAAWAPCPGLAAVVVLDAHDEALVQEQAPTWWATTVAAERARRAGAPCLWVTPAPTLDLLVAAGPPHRLPLPAERGGWAPLDVVDRRDDDPRLGLWSERLTLAVRDAGRVVCVLNRTGRARLLACAACRAVARCERCGAAVAQPASDDPLPPLVCRRCGQARPPVCQDCHSTRLRRLRTGVTRAREELAALAGRPVGEVTATGASGADAPVLIGTEAVLHRAELTGAVDVVAFVDFDQELLAPRLRAGEEALALLARASRLVGGGSGRTSRGRVLVQTRLPDHEAIAAARHADPSLLSDLEGPTRRALRLPPYAAMAVVAGPEAEPFSAAVAAGGPVERLHPEEGRWALRAADAAALCDALERVRRPAGRLRVEVDPVRI